MHIPQAILHPYIETLCAQLPLPVSLPNVPAQRARLQTLARCVLQVKKVNGFTTIQMDKLKRQLKELKDRVRETKGPQQSDALMEVRAPVHSCGG